MKKLRFEFVTPPLSVNDSLAAYQGRLIKTKKGRAWVKSMNKELTFQSGELPIPCYFEIDIYTPGQYAKDIDNCIKPLIDVLVKAKRIPDDFYMMRVVNQFARCDKIIVHISELPLEKWQAVKNPSPGTLGKLRKAQIDKPASG